MQLLGADEEIGFRFGPLRVGQTAFDRADSLACLVVVEAHALGAEVRVDDVDVIALANGFVRALGFASAAVDAFFGDMGGHGEIVGGSLETGVGKVNSRTLFAFESGEKFLR